MFIVVGLYSAIENFCSIRSEKHEGDSKFAKPLVIK